MDLIDRLRTYASTRKGELAELITEAADALERQTCEDAVSRADLLETYADLYDVFEDSKAICKELHKVYDRINALPAVQPLVIHCTDCEDWLERQSILGFTISELPSVQPQTEIIRCKDCKYWREHKYAKETKRYIPFCGFNAINTKADDYCSRAERRTDETDRC